jgi:hypothetical protein
MTSADYAAYDIRLKACADTVATDDQQILTADTAAAAKRYSGSCSPGSGHCLPITGPRFDAWKVAIDTAQRARDTLKANFPIGADGKIPLAQCDAHLSTLPTDLQAVLALYAAVPG